MAKQRMPNRLAAPVAGAAAAFLGVVLPLAVASGAGEVVCAADEAVVCFQPGGEERLWVALEGEHILGLAQGPRRLFVATSSGLTALGISDGRTAWSRPDSGYTFAPRFHDGRVYAGSRDGGLFAYTAAGERVWARRFDGWVYAPAIVDGRALTGGQGGFVQALDAATGEALWRKRLGQELVGPALALDGAAVVATYDRRVQSLQASDGSRRWQARLPSPARRLAEAGGRVFALDLGGGVTALDAVDGSRLWRRRPQSPAIDIQAEPGRVRLILEDHRLLTLAAAGGERLGERRYPVSLRGLTRTGRYAVAARPLRLLSLPSTNANDKTTPQ